MPMIYASRVRETTTTTGAGTLTLAGAVSGFQSFAAVGNGNTCTYTLLDANGTGWETGIGTYTASGTTLARTTVLESSNSGSPISLSDGTHQVFLDFSASRAAYLEKHIENGYTYVQNDGSATQSVTQGTNTKVTVINSEVADPLSWWDNTNKKFLPNRAGKYFICASLQFSTFGEGKLAQLILFKNGSSAIAGPGFGAPGSWVVITVSGILELNGSTDYLEIYTYQGDSSSRTTNASQGNCTFAAIYLGP